MKDGFDSGKLVPWARDGLGLAWDAEFSISDERARELLAQIAKGDQDWPFMELAAAYGNQMRRILAGRVRDKAELEDVEQDFWVAVVQNAGKYGGKSPVAHWLSVIAMRQAINWHQRQVRRIQLVAYRSEMASKMRDDGEEDDLDLERLADHDAIAEGRPLSPDEVLEQEELSEEARRVVKAFLDFVDAETAEAVVRNKVEGIPFEAWAKRTGKVGGSTLKMRVSRAYRKMRKKVPTILRRTLVHVYRGGGLGYAKKKSKKSP